MLYSSWKSSVFTKAWTHSPGCSTPMCRRVIVVLLCHQINLTLSINGDAQLYSSIHLDLQCSWILTLVCLSWICFYRDLISVYTQWRNFRVWWGLLHVHYRGCHFHVYWGHFRFQIGFFRSDRFLTDQFRCRFRVGLIRFDLHLRPIPLNLFAITQRIHTFIERGRINMQLTLVLPVWI